MNKTRLPIAIAAVFALAAPMAFVQAEEYADDPVVEEAVVDENAAPGDVAPILSEPDVGTVEVREVPAANPDAMRTATYPIETGTLTARSAQPAPKAGEHVPPASFAELDDNGDGLISESEARDNLALVNDFIHADLDRDNHVSACELEHWKRG